MSTTNATDWERLGAFPQHDEEPEAEAHCDECLTLSTALENARALLRTIRRMEAKPAKRETPDDTPATLQAVGHASYVAAVHTRIDLFLEEPEIERARRNPRRRS
jgi:hypothetical protein